MENMNPNLIKIASMRRGLGEVEYYTRIMEGIHGLGDNPTDKDVEMLIKILKKRGCKSLTQIKAEEDAYIKSGFSIERFEDIDFKSDLPKGGPRTAEYFIATLLDNPERANITLGIINQPNGKIETWLNARRSLLQSPTYIQHKGEDLKAFIASKQNEEPGAK